MFTTDIKKEAPLLEHHSNLNLFQRCCIESTQNIVRLTFSESDVAREEHELLCNVENVSYSSMLYDLGIFRSGPALEKLFCVCATIANDNLSDSIASFFHRFFTTNRPSASTQWFPDSRLLVRCLFLLGLDLSSLEAACEYSDVDSSCAPVAPDVVTSERELHADLKFEQRFTNVEASRVRRRLSTILALYHRAVTRSQQLRAASTSIGGNVHLALDSLVLLQLSLCDLCDHVLLKHILKQIFLLASDSATATALIFNPSLGHRFLRLAGNDLHRAVHLFLFMNDSLPSVASASMRSLFHSSVFYFLVRSLFRVHESLIFADTAIDVVVADLSFDRLWLLIWFIRDLWMATEKNGEFDEKLCSAVQSRADPPFAIQDAYLSLLLSRLLVDGQIHRRLIDVDADATEEQVAEDGRAFIRFVQQFGTLHSSIPEYFSVERFKLKRHIRQMEQKWVPLATDVSRSVNVDDEVEMLPLQFIRSDFKVDVKTEATESETTETESQSQSEMEAESDTKPEPLPDLALELEAGDANNSASTDEYHECYSDDQLPFIGSR